MINKNLFFLLIFSILCTANTYSQEKTYKVGCIGFYNFENLFDTENDPATRDGEFTPKGSNRWTEELYREKLDRLATVVAKLGMELTQDGAAILGVSEIENRKVLEDFVNHPKLKDRNYQIVHYDSPDRRGVDVGLIYQPKYFQVESSKSIPLTIYRKDSSRVYTRDILCVNGLFDGEPLTILVNHWPSRRGGEKATQPFRNAGADVCKAVVDSLCAANPNNKVIIMGDLNDDPTSPSIKKHLAAEGQKSKVDTCGLYNPMYNFYKKGFGSNAYRDAWSLFDQIIVSQNFLTREHGGYYFYRAIIFNKKYLVQKTGQYRGYPFRTFSGGRYIGGYSDHFPVYVFLIKEL